MSGEAATSAQQENANEELKTSSPTGVSERDTTSPTPKNVGQTPKEASDPGIKTSKTQNKRVADGDSAKAQKSSTSKTNSSAVSAPAYGGHYGEIRSGTTRFGTLAKLAADGRINVRLSDKSRRLSNLLVPVLRERLRKTSAEPEPQIPPALGTDASGRPPPPLNVVIQVVGSRGDVQPFVALGKVLKSIYHHRVRLATHPVFKDFVEEHGLEFFSIGGNPSDLMSFMVKNPGLMPAFDTLRRGDVGKHRKMIATMIKGCWRSCIESGNGLGVEATDGSYEDWMNWSVDDSVVNDPSAKPFVADAIIANPPSFAHMHVAEKMGIPLHMMFTMPWSPTQAFPHPLANIQSSDADPHLMNFLSYTLVDMLTVQGLGDVLNRFRTKVLNLEPMSLMWAPGLLARLKVPFTYCWSPALIPRPRDWGNYISIAGFYFLDQATSYQPATDLQEFLDAGPPPVYIGFGSIVVDDPDGMTRLIFEAVEKSGQRALVSKGWGGFGSDSITVPDNVFMLGNVPHDWLFHRVSCVVHHGGAGTTSAGIACGKPTVVVPFFGDQPFWGAMVARAGAGPKPVPSKTITADALAEAIQQAIKPESIAKAKELAAKIAHETGNENGAAFFHQKLDIDKMRCMIDPDRTAVWRIKKSQTRLSALAATTLVNEGLLNFENLKLYRPMEYDTEDGPMEPITGGASAIVGDLASIMMGVADFPVEALKALKIHPDAVSKDKATSGADSPGSSTKSPSESALSQGESNKDQVLPKSPEKADMDRLAASVESKLAVPDPGSPPRPRSASTNSPPGVSSPSQHPVSADHRVAMADALDAVSDRRSRSRASSTTRSRASSQASNNQSPITSPSQSAKIESDLADALDWEKLETLVGTSKGIGRIIATGLKSPMDFSLNVARGFHNAPKLYGDDTVRPTEKITGFQSGLKAATKGFGYGVYDGITGLVTQPIAGLKKEGGAGFIKGIGKGIGGVVLKPSGAFWSIPGYSMKGLYKEIQKLHGSSAQSYILASRLAQGYEEWNASTEEERAEIIRLWSPVRELAKSQKPKHVEKLERLRQRHHDGVERLRSLSLKSPSRTSPSSSRTDLSQSQSQQQTAPHSLQSIDHIVRQTSHGSPEEDAMVHRALYASLEEKRHHDHPTSPEQEEEDFRRALQASVTDAHLSAQPAVFTQKELDDAMTHDPWNQDSDFTGSDEEDDIEDRAMKRVMTEAQAHADAIKQVKSNPETGNPAASTSDGQALHNGPGSATATALDDSEDHELQRALTASMESHAAEATAQQQAAREEAIVMAYMQRQSVAEDAHRKALQETRIVDREDLTAGDGQDSGHNSLTQLKEKEKNEGVEG